MSSPILLRKPEAAYPSLVVQNSAVSILNAFTLGETFSSTSCSPLGTDCLNSDLFLCSNWLRDYSQAVDIAGLKKLPLQTIINLCMALGFLVGRQSSYMTPEI